MGWFFLFFVISGFCSVLYEIVWLRLSMAQFGVTSGMVSIVLSMFMAGLGLGSWLSGHLIRRYSGRITFPALRVYALAELLIAVSAILVPLQLQEGRSLLQHVGVSSSGPYYIASGIWIALTLIPWCACMGATIPVAMLAIRETFQKEAQRSFSFLYLANVLGAMAGATLPLLLIELYGFRGTLKVGAGMNGLLAASAMALSFKRTSQETTIASLEDEAASLTLKPVLENTKLLALLFTTGLTSMGMEVVWIRQFTPYLSTVVYAFASILGLYLLSTFIGSQIYRRWSRNHEQEGRLIWIFLGLFALLPLITANPAIHFSRLLRLVLGIVPFSGVLGFVTPMLVDRWSGGDPDRAGSAYAVNVVGCILGPLVSGFLLLPLMSERWVLPAFSLPWLVIGVYPRLSSAFGERRPEIAWQRYLSYGVIILALLLVFEGRGYEDRFDHRIVLRDNTATIIATGNGMRKLLLVNGYGITGLATVTKIMAHLPMAFLDHPPQNSLVVCFGMGTTYRSLLSWRLPTTAVELVPSVPRTFWYYHSDGEELLRSPLSRVVIDDGRRYLERAIDQYDVIALDPPPPVEAAGSSLLYSVEFYNTAKQRLRSGGILQQWLPGGDAADRAAVARALMESFPYVRVFRDRAGRGVFFLASSSPIPNRTAEELAQRMPATAAKDLVEWEQGSTPESIFGALLKNEIQSAQLIAEAPRAPALRDDLPVNEYYLLRRRLMPRRWQ
jgi:spermidine synthase